MKPVTSLDQNALVGFWDLEAYVIEKDGTTLPFAPVTKGALIYSGNGTVSVLITGLSSDEKTVENVIAYLGTFEVEGGMVRHSVTIASKPNYNGTTVERAVSLSGNTLELATTTPVTGATHRIKWRRRCGP